MNDDRSISPDKHGNPTRQGKFTRAIWETKTLRTVPRQRDRHQPRACVSQGIVSWGHGHQRQLLGGTLRLRSWGERPYSVTAPSIFFVAPPTPPQPSQLRRRALLHRNLRSRCRGRRARGSPSRFFRVSTRCLRCVFLTSARKTDAKDCFG